MEKANQVSVSETLKLPGLELMWWLAASALMCVCAWMSHSLAASSPPVSSMRVNVNAAHMEDLLSLPGMTGMRARAILKERDKRGGFKDVDALGEVKGITNAYLKRIEDLIEVKP